MLFRVALRTSAAGCDRRRHEPASTRGEPLGVPPPEALSSPRARLCVVVATQVAQERRPCSRDTDRDAHSLETSPGTAAAPHARMSHLGSSAENDLGASRTSTARGEQWPVCIVNRACDGSGTEQARDAAKACVRARLELGDRVGQRAPALHMDRLALLGRAH
jgi:hypothetical protein